MKCESGGWGGGTKRGIGYYVDFFLEGSIWGVEDALDVGVQDCMRGLEYLDGWLLEMEILLGCVNLVC